MLPRILRAPRGWYYYRLRNAGKLAPNSLSPAGSGAHPHRHVQCAARARSRWHTRTHTYTHRVNVKKLKISKLHTEGVGMQPNQWQTICHVCMALSFITSTRKISWIGKIYKGFTHYEVESLGTQTPKLKTNEIAFQFSIEVNQGPFMKSAECAEWKALYKGPELILISLTCRDRGSNVTPMTLSWSSQGQKVSC